MDVRQQVSERSERFLEPGEQIVEVVLAQTGPNRYLVLLTGWLHLFTQRRILLVTDRSIVVVRAGRFGRTPKAVLRRMPRDTPLGPLSGLLTRVRLGGESLWIAERFRAAVARADGAAPAPAPTADRSSPSTAPAPVALPATVGEASAELKVRVGGHEYEFEPGTTVTFGRDPECDVVSEHPLVSRVHAQARSTATGWVLEDAGSRRGTEWGGAPVTTLPLRGAMSVWFGPTDAGERVLFATAGTAPTAEPGATSARRLQRLVLSIGAALMVVVVLSAFMIVRGGTPAKLDLDRLELGTVQLSATEGGVTYRGSGTVISSDGLILTNAHVAAPRAIGTGVREQLPIQYQDVAKHNFPFVTVLVAADVRSNVVPRYRAKVVAADGYLDLAVVQIYAKASGRPVDASRLHLTTVEIGDSSTVDTGDPVRVFGFPAISDSEQVDSTTGVIGAPVSDSRLSGAAYFNTDARIAHGNSGGLAADAHGRIIGVPSRFRAGKVDQGEEGTGRIRPINLARGLIAAAEAGRHYNSYTHVVAAAPDASARSAGFAGKSCGTGAQGTDAVFRAGFNEVTADFTMRGVAHDEDAWVGLVDGDGHMVADSGRRIDTGCQRFELRADTALAPGVYTAMLFVGPNLEHELAVQHLAVTRS